MRDNFQQPTQGDPARLSFTERELLETQILPTARKWLKIPALADHGKSTLAYWGQS